MGQVKILHGMFLLLSIFLVFLYLNNPFQEIKELAQLSLFFLISAAFLFIIFIKSPKLMKIQLESSKEFFNEYSIGALLGLVAYFASVQLAMGLDKVINFTGSVSAMSVQTMSDTALLFLVQVLPLVETLILVGITVVVANFLPKNIPMKYLVAGVIASLAFAAFHFSAVAGPLSAEPGAFEYSVEGFVDFVTSMDGALIHFAFGFVSIVLFLGFRSFIILYSLHAVNNLLAAVAMVGWVDLLVAVAVLDVGIVTLTVLYAKPFKKLNEFRLARVFASG